MQVPGYEIGGQLGRGGQASVFRAQTAAGAEVALKVFPVVQTERTLGRFRREAQALQAIAHPGVVRVLDHGVVDGRPFMALELIDGVSLSQAVVHGLTIDAALDVAAQLAEALSAVHAAGITHRDVKPDNVLLAEGRVVLADFGLAHFSAAGSHSLTQSGALLGTPAYMAPEAANGKLETIGPAADVYGWAATVFEALTQRPPFSGDSLVGLLRAISEERAPGLQSLRPDAPDWLAQLVASCLAKSPRERPADGAALVAAFARAQPQSSPARGHAVLAVALGVGSLLALAVGAAIWASPPPAEPGPAAVTEDPERGPDPAEVLERTLEIELDPLRGRDTFVDGWALYTNDNFGSERSLHCGVRAGRGYAAPRQIYLWFPLDQLPTGARVTSAVLELCEPTSRPAYAAIAAYTVLEPWVEGAGGVDDGLDGVAWGEGHQPLSSSLFARPTHDEPALDVANAPAPGEPARWDVTQAVQRWQGDARTNHGVCLAPLPTEERPPDGVRYRGFRSRDVPDPTDRPRLVVHYVGPAAAAVTPFAERLASRRADVRTALRAAARSPGAARLRLLNELLVAMPSDVEVRAARIRTFLELDMLETAVHDGNALARVHVPADSPATSRAVVELVEDVERSELGVNKRFIAWHACWTVLGRETAPEVPVPARGYRIGTVQRRVPGYGVQQLHALYQRGLEVWPGNAELQDELDALPFLCLRVGRLLLEHPQDGGRTAAEIASEALEVLDCSPSQRAQLEQLLADSK